MIKQRKEKKERKKRLIRLLLLVALICLASYFFIFSKHKKSTEQAETTAFTEENNQTVTPTQAQIIPTQVMQNSAGLESAVEKALEGTHGTYGVVVKNLTTNETYFLNEKHTFNSASLYKLWVMAEVYQEIQEGKLHIQYTLNADVVALNKKFGVEPDPNEQTTGKITLTIQDALYQMITISSNNAALLLTNKISVSSLVSFLQKNGFMQSKIGIQGQPPTTTPYDIAVFLEKLYHGDLANKEYTDAMITLLKQQRLNDKLPKYLPDNIQAAHKTGELESNTHDAGIIYTPNGEYILVVMSESDSPDLAKERIALVSQNVYNYFSGNNTTQ